MIRCIHAFAALSLIAASPLYAQTYTGGTVSYTTIESEADKYKRSALYFNLANADTYNDISVGYGFRAETVIGNLLMPWYQYNTAWLDAAMPNLHYGYPLATTGTNKHTTNEFGGALFFTNKNKSKSVKVILKNGSTYQKYIMIPAKVKGQSGVRAGVFVNSKALELTDEIYKRFNYTSLDGSINEPIGSTGIQPAGASYRAYPQMRATSMFLGLHHRKVKNVRIAVGSKKRSNLTVVDTYFDLMFNSSTAVSNVTDLNGKEWKITMKDDLIRNVGWRIGMGVHSAGSFHVQYSGEFGKRPGVMVGNSFTSNGTYILLSAGVSIASGKYLHLKPEPKKKTE